MRLSSSTYVALFVMLLLACALFMAGHTPVYTDEVSYKIFLERFFISGGFKQSVTPFCEGDFLVKPGITLLPAAAFWSLISFLGNNYLSYRILPLLALVLIWGLLAFINIRKGNHDFWPLLLFIIAGPSLFGLVLLRPEIFILCFGLLLFTIGQSVLQASRLTSILALLAAALLVYILAIYIHPKAIYLAALMMGIAAFSVQRLRGIPQKFLVGLLFLLALLATTYQAYTLHTQQFMQCHSLPAIEQRIQSVMAIQAVNPLSLVLKPQEFIDNMGEAYSETSMKRLVDNVSYGPTYQVDFLPPINPFGQTSANANMLIYILAIGFALYFLIKFYMCATRLTDADERRRLVLSGLFIATLAVPFVLNITRHFYEISYAMGMLMIAATIMSSFRIAGNSPTYTLLAQLTSIPVVGIATICLALSWINYMPALEKGYTGPGLTYLTNRARINEAIQQLLDKNGIAQNEPLMVDDATYDSVRNHPVVIPITYFSLIFNVPKAAEHYLEMYHTNYGVTRCHYLESALKGHVKYTILSSLPYADSLTPSTVQEKSVCVFKLQY